jgi:hypothetical protein
MQQLGVFLATSSLVLLAISLERKFGFPQVHLVLFLISLFAWFKLVTEISNNWDDVQRSVQRWWRWLDDVTRL